MPRERLRASLSEPVDDMSDSLVDKIYTISLAQTMANGRNVARHGIPPPGVASPEEACVRNDFDPDASDMPSR